MKSIINDYIKKKILNKNYSQNITLLNKKNIFVFPNFKGFQIGFLVFLSIIAVLSSIVRVVLRHFNLTVFVKNSALEIYQGLTTKKSVILKKDKVQHITISHNPIKKKLGISFITFKQAISGKVKTKQDKIIKIVGCKVHQVSAIKDLLFPNENLEVLDKSFSDNYFRVRLYLRGFLVLCFLNILFYLIFENSNVFWVNSLLIPIFIVAIEVSFKKRHYLFNTEVLLVGSGIIETHKTYVPFFKVQNVKLKQTIFQAQKNVADLVFQTASGKIKIPSIQLEKAQQIYNYTLFKVETSKKSWM